VAISVFYSFHYERDSFRVQQVLQMGALEGQTILNSQEWEQVKRQGSAAIEKWIDGQMSYKRAVVVLVGAETASRSWVDYEIRKAWADRKPLVGIRIHGLSNGSSTDRPGANPFGNVQLPLGQTLANYIPLHNPAGGTSKEVHADIARNLTSWVDGAVRR
jgi:hypothetical protein